MKRSELKTCLSQRHWQENKETSCRLRENICKSNIWVLYPKHKKNSWSWTRRQTSQFKNGVGLKQVLYRRACKDVREAHEEMVTPFAIREMHMETMTCHPALITVAKWKVLTLPSADKDVVQLELTSCWGECKNVTATWFSLSYKVKIHLILWPHKPIPGYFLRPGKTSRSHKKQSMNGVAALFTSTIAKGGSNPDSLQQVNG